jgi:anti-sigma regulatory factor (Ser/Thr protein kinase)
VRQIVMNLASNAIKFTDKGWVTITAWRDMGERPERVRISVSDTGVGVAERDLERIFEEFEQVRPSGRGDSLQRGTGLGLAIARKLARLLGGDVAVESRPGQGSRFTLHLPLVARRIPREQPLEHEVAVERVDESMRATESERPSTSTVSHRDADGEPRGEHVLSQARTRSTGLDGDHIDG